MKGQHQKLPKFFLQAHFCESALDPRLRTRRKTPAGIFTSGRAQTWRVAGTWHQQDGRRKQAGDFITNGRAASAFCCMRGLRRRSPAEPPPAPKSIKPGTICIQQMRQPTDLNDKPRVRNRAAARVSAPNLAGYSTDCAAPEPGLHSPGCASFRFFLPRRKFSTPSARVMRWLALRMNAISRRRRPKNRR